MLPQENEHDQVIEHVQVHVVKSPIQHAPRLKSQTWRERRSWVDIGPVQCKIFDAWSSIRPG